MSQRTAAPYGVDRTKLQAPLMLEGPSGVTTSATENGTIAFFQERAVGGKMVIFAFVVDVLEEFASRQLAEVADAAGPRRRRIPAVIESCAARRPPLLRADPG